MTLEAPTIPGPGVPFFQALKKSSQVALAGVFAVRFVNSPKIRALLPCWRALSQMKPLGAKAIGFVPAKSFLALPYLCE